MYGNLDQKSTIYHSYILLLHKARSTIDRLKAVGSPSLHAAINIMKSEKPVVWH